MTNPVSNPGRIKVLLVDDHQMFAQVLRRVFKDTPDLEVVGTAGTVAEAVTMARQAQPDVVLMDYQLPDGVGTEAAEAIRREHPDTKVVMLTGYADDAVLVAAIEVGCSGFISKANLVEEALTAVRAAAAGEALISPSMLIRLLPRLRQERKTVSFALTSRELEVLRLLAGGASNAVIAESLFLSVNTVRKHVQSILNKLDAHSKLEAAAIAVRQGIVVMGEDGPELTGRRPA